MRGCGAFTVGMGVSPQLPARVDAGSLGGPADLFKAMFDASRVASFVFEEPTLRIVIVNAAACAFYGYGEDSLLDMTVPDLLDASHWQRARAAMAGGQARDVDNIHRHADGHPLSVRVSAYRMVTTTKVIWNVQVQDRSDAVAGLRMSIEGAVTAVQRALRARDPYTANHQSRVAVLSEAIAERLGLSGDVIDGLRTAAELHDIGKIGLPSEILNFPGPLSGPAMELVRTHAQVGHDLIESIPFPWPVARIVLEHHERLDGSGYPRGLSAGDLLMQSKILAVADVAEAMTAHRPYRPALPLSSALDELQGGQGSRYDTDAVTACTGLLRHGGFQFPGLPLG